MPVCALTFNPQFINAVIILSIFFILQPPGFEDVGLLPAEESRDQMYIPHAPPHHGSHGSMYGGTHADMQGRPGGYDHILKHSS